MVPAPTNARVLAWGLLATLALAAGRVRAEEPSAPAPAPAPAPDPASKATLLRVATYNAWAIPFVSDERRERLDRMPAALAALELDVLCLQEMWTGADQRRLRDALHEVLPHAVLARGGLMLLARHPIVSSKFVSFPRYDGLSVGELLAGKGLLDVVLRTPAGRVRIFTSHLALAFGEDNPRSKQLRFCLRHMASQRSLPLVLAADLNTWPVERGELTADYHVIVAQGFIDAKAPVRDHGRRWDPGRPTRMGWPRVEGRTKGWYPDHLLFRPGARTGVALRRFRMALDTVETALSDHNLLFADLAFTSRPAKRSSRQEEAK